MSRVWRLNLVCVLSCWLLRFLLLVLVIFRCCVIFIVMWYLIIGVCWWFGRIFRSVLL